MDGLKPEELFVRPIRIVRILLFAILFFAVATVAIPWLKTVLVRYPVPGDWVLDFDRFGPVRVGMDKAQTLALLDFPFEEQSPNDPQDCMQLVPKRPDRPMRLESPVFMMTQGRLSRIDIFGEPWQTIHGLRIGDDAAVLKSGQLGTPQVGPNHYDDTVTEYVFELVAQDGERYAMLYAADRSGKIIHFRSGRAGEISFVEGCL